MIANRSSPGPGRGRRRGFGLIEMAACGVMLAAAMVVTVQVVSWVAVERRAVGRRERAVREAANLLERAAARPWDELTPASLAGLRLSDSTAAALPGAGLEARVATSDDAPARKKITIEVRWRDRSGRPEAPVRLVTWAYRRGGPKP